MVKAFRFHNLLISVTFGLLNYTKKHENKKGREP